MKLNQIKQKISNSAEPLGFKPMRVQASVAQASVVKGVHLQ